MCNTSLTTDQMSGIALHDGVFYAMDWASGVAGSQVAYRSANPCTAFAWTQTSSVLGLGTNVGNFAIGNFDSYTFDSCDYDQDGIASHLDLDSDGDLCIDAFEGDSLYRKADIDANMLQGAVDSLGIPILVSPLGQGSGTSQDSTSIDPACVRKATYNLFLPHKLSNR